MASLERADELGGPRGPYTLQAAIAACHATAATYEETDWSTRFTAQVGYWIPVGTRGSVHRLALEFGTGRSVMGQFLWENETYSSIGWYYDW